MLRFRKRGLFWSVVLILALCLSSAVWAESTVTLTALDNQISTAEQAQFTLTIVNHQSQSQRYSVFSLGQGWSVYTSPLKDRIIEIPGGASYTTTIVVDPTKDFMPGIYYVHINVESDAGEAYAEPMKIYLGPERPMDYLPSLKVEVDMDSRIDVKKPVSIKLFLENKNPLDLSKMTLRIQSEIPEFQQSLEVNLPPLGKKTMELTITPNPYQQPKEYVLFFIFEQKEQTIKVVEQRIEIQTLLPDFGVEVVKNTIFFKQFWEVTVTNEGNVRNTQKVEVPLPFLGSLLAQGEGVLIEKGKEQTVARWELDLGPNESKKLSLVVNYRIIAYVVALLLAALMFYMYVQSPLSITKTAVTTKSDEEGALSEIKITLEVQNHSKKVVKDVDIIDIIPDIANMEKSLELGTLKPQEMKHIKEGTKVRWNLAEVDASEHRLITYKIRAKLNILGVFSLPRAAAEYKKGKKTRKAYSNVFRLGTQ